MRSRLVLARLDTIRHSLALLPTSPNRERDLSAVLASLIDAITRLASIVEEIEQKAEAAESK
jgi:hypothetical protein